MSLKGTNVDLLHFLFGSVLALDDPTLLLIAGITTLSLVVLALIYRPLVLECVDPGFLRSVSRAGAPAHIAFLALVVMNLVGGFHALGTLLAVGIMMLPAVIARFWARDITAMIADRGRAAARSRAMPACCVSFHAGAAVRARRSSWWRARSTRCRCCSGRVGGLIALLPRTPSRSVRHRHADMTSLLLCAAARCCCSLRAGAPRRRSSRWSRPSRSSATS